MTGDMGNQRIKPVYNEMSWMIFQEEFRCEGDALIGYSELVGLKDSSAQNVKVPFWI